MEEVAMTTLTNTSPIHAISLKDGSNVDDIVQTGQLVGVP